MNSPLSYVSLDFNPTLSSLIFPSLQSKRSSIFSPYKNLYDPSYTGVFILFTVSVSCSCLPCSLTMSFLVRAYSRSSRISSCYIDLTNPYIIVILPYIPGFLLHSACGPSLLVSGHPCGISINESDTSTASMYWAPYSSVTRYRLNIRARCLLGQNRLGWEAPRLLSCGLLSDLWHHHFPNSVSPFTSSVCLFLYLLRPFSEARTDHPFISQQSCLLRLLLLTPVTFLSESQRVHHRPSSITQCWYGLPAGQTMSGTADIRHAIQAGEINVVATSMWTSYSTSQFSISRTSWSLNIWNKVKQVSHLAFTLFSHLIPWACNGPGSFVLPVHHDPPAWWGLPGRVWLERRHSQIANPSLCPAIVWANNKPRPRCIGGSTSCVAPGW
jgi:hypothetical protein